MMRFLRRPPRPGGLSCAQVADLVQSFLDDELTETTGAKLAEHLDQCERCGIEADVYRRIKAALSGVAPSAAVDRLQAFALTVADPP